jgi:hypothetical protein
MKNILLAILAVIIIGLGSYYISKNGAPSESGTDTVASTTPDTTMGTGTTTKPVTKPTGTTGSIPNTAGFYSYSNADHNFTVKYPAYVKFSSTFSTFHEVGNNWRLYAAPANQGKGITELTVFSVDQGQSSATGQQSYPVYFSAQVRISAGPNVKECYTPDSGYTNQKITNVVINGVTFKRFSTSDAAMMKYVQAESYRTIHNNQCYVLEQIKSGSTYKDDKMKPGIADSTLNAYYAMGETIIKTFKFTK